MNFLEFIIIPIGAFFLVSIPLLVWAKREMWD
jgi:hypothetical protein